MGIFNNREIAIGIWIVLLLLFLIIHKPSIKSLFDFMPSIIDAAFQPVLVRIYIVITVYVGCMIYLLYKLNLWDIGLLKNTLIWFVFIALLFMGKAANSKNNYKGLFEELILSNFKIIIVVEFIVGFYPRSLVIELIVIPVMTFITLLMVFSENKEEHATVHKLFSNIVFIVGILVISRALYLLITHFGDFAKLKTLADFSLVPILSILYLPLVFTLYIYTCYETKFLSLHYVIKDKHVRGYAKYQSLFAFNVHVSKLDEWTQLLIHDDIETKEDVIKSIKKYKSYLKKSKKPPTVKPKKGWSPYKAEKFLEDEGLVTKIYHSGFEGEWYASSASLFLTENFDSNSITYSIYGVKKVVTKLKIILHIRNDDESELSGEKLKEVFSTLVSKARIKPLRSQNQSEHITLEEGEIVKVKYASIKSKRDVWNDDSYDITFTILHDEHIEGI